MTSYFTKNFFIFLYTLYICLRLLNRKKIATKYYLPIFILISFLAGISCLFDHYIVSFTYIIPITIIWLIIGHLTESPLSSFIFTTSSFTISYCIFALSAFVSTIIATPIFHINSNHLNFGIILLSGVLQFIFTLMLFNIKRFKSGMPFLRSTTLVNLLTIACIIIIQFLIYMQSNTIEHKYKIFALLLLTISLVIFLHWWQAQITKSYKQALINRELESLRMELEEKEKQLAELAARNEELGRLIHKDNKRIPAMEHAVSEFLVMDLTDKENAIERGNTLLLEIQKLSEDRNNTVTEIYARKYKHHDTGITELDTMLNYMEKRAYGEHIKLSVQSAINFHDFVPNNISPEDLSHVLSDLLENAIIASKQTTSPVIQLQFYQTGKDFVIEIADNGIPFEAASLVSFGLEQLTTHSDTGGSGIGLMDIWKIKEKYGISLHITEYKEDAPYTKKIALIFNKKNRYTISTERKEELLAISKRTDLQIF